ncbi:MAG TPA: hypothetical protein PKZ97_00280 [Azospirillaceae bacterium]|nr:hypothetical protein [Azospirillaceae bacterium]HRQ79534.1 hypothetical protein [Azospirillaceae bacterium]
MNNKFNGMPALLGAVAMLALGGCVSDGDYTPMDLTKSEGVVIQSPGQSPGGATRLGQIPFTPPQWAVGDAWSYSDGMGFKVAAVDGRIGKFQRTDDPKQWFTADGVFRLDSQSRAALRKAVYNSDDIQKLYSARPGQSITFQREYTRNGVLVRHQTSWTIDGYERINVPAGSFDTIKLTKRSRSLTGNWTGFERWWYSPQAKNYVRMEYRYGEAPESARVLTSYTVQ